MSISGKVTASTVAASVTTVISGILAPHVFTHGVPSDVRGLIEGGATAVITFVAGYLAKHGIDGGKLAGDVLDVAEDLGVPFMALSDAPEAPADVVAAGPGSVAAGGDIVGSVVTGVAQPLV
ncbi:hypothetical protein ACFVYV_09400 [Streptomyces mirabilis]|uniref:hypothetical protein n=1 Tax=Streptomyces mirabilis TaxID=68239 RepID=UPI0036DBD48D